MDSTLKSYFAKILLISSLLVYLFPAETICQSGTDRYAVVIGGLGGESRYSSTFAQYLHDTRSALIDVCGFNPLNVKVLSERSVAEKDFVDTVSTAENIEAVFAELSGRIDNDDEFFLILFGHGSFNGTDAMLNIPRKDLTSVDYARLLSDTGAGTTVLINTASSSGPFISSSSAPGRVVITATRSEGQRNVTQFPEFFLQGMKDMTADLDRNGDLSLTEIFSYAVQMTDKFYEDQGSIATEHAILEDTGDAHGFRAQELEENGEGLFAATIFLKQKYSGLITDSATKTDSVFIRLVEEQRTIEAETAELKQKKPDMVEEEYYSRLESLMLRLAAVTDSLEKYKKIR